MVARSLNRMLDWAERRHGLIRYPVELLLLVAIVLVMPVVAMARGLAAYGRRLRQIWESRR